MFSPPRRPELQAICGVSVRFQPECSGASRVRARLRESALSSIALRRRRARLSGWWSQAASMRRLLSFWFCRRRFAAEQGPVAGHVAIVLGESLAEKVAALIVGDEIQKVGLRGIE